MRVKVSDKTEEKVALLKKLMRYSLADHAWGKDQKMLRYNILQVPATQNYKVLIAMGQKSRRSGASS